MSRRWSTDHFHILKTDRVSAALFLLCLVRPVYHGTSSVLEYNAAFPFFNVIIEDFVLCDFEFSETFCSVDYYTVFYYMYFQLLPCTSWAGCMCVLLAIGMHE